ncbi:N-acetylglucosamine kinase [Kribbella deserti]|uniref:N-acetylglucosamine kinase n=1 Tax=Kribbella deserti TaxID=1926257 RepID=A0ABV6QVD7_9ACTN
MSIPTGLAIAVDGGQSGLRLRVLPDGRGGSGPGYTHGDKGIAATLAAVRRAAGEAGVLGEPVEVACLGLTGYPNDPSDVRMLAADLAELLNASEIRLCVDMVTAHAGALPDGYGVVIAAGTGSVCLAVDHGGTSHRVDGHGYLFGDVGSAFWIGRAGISALLRARDGRGPDTALAGLDFDPISLYPSPTVVDDVARFTPVVLRFAAEGDFVAQGIVLDAATGLADTIAAGINSLPGVDLVPVACVGGVFQAGEQLLAPLRDRLPARADLRPAAGTPLDGAARLATGPLGPYERLVTVYRSGAGE